MTAQEPSVPVSISEDFTLLPALRDPRYMPEEYDGRRPASSSSSAPKVIGFRARIGLEKVARRTLGIILLLITVFLWTGSNFLASYIFADNTFSKPYFVTYVNTSFFAFSLIPIFIRIAHQQGYRKIRSAAVEYWQTRLTEFRSLRWKSIDGETTEDQLDQDESSDTRLLAHEDASPTTTTPPMQLVETNDEANQILSVRETAILSLEFSLLWFVANYFVAACLEYTSVASSTILTSTSSIWTLIFGAVLNVERFSFKKLVGVLASLAGIILISTVDLSGDNDENRGSFPHKSQRQLAIGDAMAAFSALIYGVYTVVMKKRVGNEDRVSMPLFFGLVGFFNVLTLWPGFLVLHYTGVESFELPSTRKIWIIILLNSVSSFVSDYCWAYAMLLTTPLVVTVGISLTIPLSLIGQMILSSQYSSALYWVGACIVFCSFLFINHESHEEESART